jgi:hypothetical protein
MASQLHSNTVRLHVPDRCSAFGLGTSVAHEEHTRACALYVPNDNFPICSTCRKVITFPVEPNRGSMAGL